MIRVKCIVVIFIRRMVRLDEEMEKHREMQESKKIIEENSNIMQVDDFCDLELEDGTVIKKEHRSIYANGSNEIIWYKDYELDNWKDIKSTIKKTLDNGEDYYEKDIDWFFSAHSKDEIIGRPQLVDSIKKNIIIGREIKSKQKYKDDDGKNQEKEIRRIVLFDDKYDKRYSGQAISSFSLGFYIYRIITKDYKEYYILSKELLPNEMCRFNGMIVKVEDLADITKTMKIGSLTSVMFMKEYKSNVVTLPPSEILEFTKGRGFTEEKWFEFLAYHRELDSFNRFPYETELLRSAHLLSSKVDGWPLHIAVLGPPGTRKSKGFIETIAYKMDDNPDIFEGANSRIKGLTPSFKEKPANLGYLANSHRMGWVDELGKMVEFEVNKHNGENKNVLGEANFLLEHSLRQVGSGNDNTATVEATAKFIFVTNPISRTKYVGDHVGSIDPTTMSRILWWVQDLDEQNFVMSPQGIIRNTPQHQDNTPKDFSRSKILKNKKEYRDWLSVGGILETIDEFLTLYDSCNAFLCDFDRKEIEILSNLVTTMAREPMKSVWKTRGEHHVSLLVDGICKHRCLFKDYDSSFVANKEDYDNTKKILIKMVNAWDTNLSIKRE